MNCPSTLKEMGRSESPATRPRPTKVQLLASWDTLPLPGVAASSMDSGSLQPPTIAMIAAVPHHFVFMSMPGCNGRAGRFDVELLPNEEEVCPDGARPAGRLRPRTARQAPAARRGAGAATQLRRARAA